MKKLTTNHTNQCEWESLFKNEEQILDIRYDPVFKAVFTRGTAKSRGALSDLISSLIGRTVMVKTIIANEPPVDDIRQKYVRYDIACTTKKGEFVNVEMSLNPAFNEPVRFEYYTAKLLTGQNIHGKKKKYSDLKECYQINILANKNIFPDKRLIHNFLYYDPEARMSLRGITRIITVELIKTKPIASKPIKQMTNAELWAVFFQYLTNSDKRDKITEIIRQEEGIAMAAAALGTITKEEREYFRNLTKLKGELDYQHGMAVARERGLKKGRREEKLEIAKNLKEMGLSISQIAKGTRLSAKTIAKL